MPRNPCFPDGAKYPGLRYRFLDHLRAFHLYDPARRLM